MRLFQYFRSLWKARFTECDVAVLNAVVDSLASPANDVCRRQSESIVKSQRHLEGREVCCYPSFTTPIVRDPGLRLLNDALELHLATVTVRGARATLLADVHLVQGYFFSIIYDISPTRLTGPFNADRVVMHADPMRPSMGLSTRPVFVGRELADWIHDYLHIDAVCEASQPLAKEERQSILLRCDATFPHDYVALLERCDGFASEGWAVLGAAQLYQVSTDTGNYTVLAERSGYGVIVVKANSRDARLYFQGFDGSTTECGRSLVEAITTGERIAACGSM